MENQIANIPSSLKYRNRELVLQCFRDYREHSVSDIVGRTGISKLTVMRAIQFFCAKNILESSGKGASTEQGGKRPEYFHFACKRHMLTIALWPESLSLTLFDMGMKEICRSSIAWIIPATPEIAFRFVREQAAALLQQAGVSAGDLYGVSLSTSGIVDYDTLTLKYSVHSPEWGNDIPVGRYLKEIFGEGCHCFVENAGKCIARAVLAEQTDAQKRTLLLFTAWGLSGALIQDGKILGGRDSLIGEIGHMIIDPSDTEKCSCGGFGCMERLVSIPRLRKRIAANLPPVTSPLAKLAPEAVTLNPLFFASQQKDPYARGHVAYLADCFATLLRNISLIFNPETVIFVGDYAIADAFFDQRIRQQFQSFHYLATSTPMDIRYDTRALPELDAKGSATALLDHFFSASDLYEDA